ncbi:universal stress protein [Georgenia sp. SYP-B2076]|uniref:universal stress protein n=1 Tax=Georgenia sp. SYP-B2076 TaxID=2495881 RepID=UPI000F8C7614|nr:universal stress protein [Georgenia sp. SYP-B2076]
MRTRHSELDVTSDVRAGRVASELIKASLDAALMVVGARGHGTLAGKLLGSVSQQVVAHAHGPVVVVRGSAPIDAGPVVVGVDVDLRTVREHPVEALRRESQETSLLVVGSRGMGGFTGLRLGSVSHGVLSRVRCAVAVVRGT